MADRIYGPADFFEEGDWNARCSMCGAKEKASKMVKNWQGLWRHPRCNEPRQPQDFVRGVQDIQTPPWVQFEEDIDIQICTYNGISAIPGLAIPGCMIPGRAAWDMDFYPPTSQPPLPFSILTEAGIPITDELGNQILVENNYVPPIFGNYILTEGGQIILTESGVGIVPESAIIGTEIFTESGLAILTEGGSFILIGP